MIKTISYNDFSHYAYFSHNDDSIPKFFNDLREFHRQGGNLDHPVLNSYEKVESLETWMQNKFKDKPEVFKQIIDEKLITNPFNFKVDHIHKTITDIEGYGLKWMKDNFKLYRPYILEAISRLANEIKDWDLGLVDGHYPTDFISYHPHDIHYVNVSKNHPLKVIADSFQDEDIFEIILNASPQNRTLWIYNDTETKELVCRYKRELTQEHIGIARLFYKHDIIRHILNNPSKSEDNYSSEYMRQIFNDALHHSDIDFIETYIKDVDLHKLDRLNDSDSLFLNRAKDLTSGKILVDNGAIIHTRNINNDSYQQFNHKINSEVLDYILKTNQEMKTMLKENPDNYIFKQFFSPNLFPSENLFNCIKILVENHQYPLDIVNFISLASKFEHSEFSHLSVLQWGIEHGYDPRNCQKFIEQSVQDRADGLKILKTLQKKNLFNSYYPDSLYYLLSTNMTKDFATWLEKAPAENFSRNTKEQKLAWWGMFNLHSSSYAQSLIFKNVSDFTQNSSSGLSLLYELTKIHDKQYHDMNQFLTKIINKKGRLSFDISGTDNEGKNLFHHLFKYHKNRMNYELLQLILDNTDDNIAKMLTQQDHQGETPLALFLNLRLQGMTNSSFADFPLLSKIIPSLNFDQPIQFIHKNENNMTMPLKNYHIFEHLGISSLDEHSSLTTYQIISSLLKNINNNHQEELSQQLESSYNNWKLYHHLDASLNQSEPERKKLKL